MALENFLWEFGGERQEWLKPRSKRNDEDMTTEADVDMLRNVQVNQIWAIYQRCQENDLVNYRF